MREFKQTSVEVGFTDMGEDVVRAVFPTCYAGIVAAAQDNGRATCELQDDCPLSVTEMLKGIAQQRLGLEVRCDSGECPTPAPVAEAAEVSVAKLGAAIERLRSERPE